MSVLTVLHMPLRTSSGEAVRGCRKVPNGEKLRTRAEPLPLPARLGGIDVHRIITSSGRTTLECTYRTFTNANGCELCE